MPGGGRALSTQRTRAGPPDDDAARTRVMTRFPSGPPPTVPVMSAAWTLRARARRVTEADVEPHRSRAPFELSTGRLALWR